MNTVYTRRRFRAKQLDLPVQNLIYAATKPTTTSPWTVTVSPNSNGLPGNNVWQDMTGALLQWGLIASVAAIVIGVIVWQVAGHGHNPHWAARGRVGALMGAGGAFLIGAAPEIVNFFTQSGQKVHQAMRLALTIGEGRLLKRVKVYREGSADP